MTDPITITRDDGSPLTLSRGEAVRAMAAVRAVDAREAADGWVTVPNAGPCECMACRYQMGGCGSE